MFENSHYKLTALGFETNTKLIRGLIPKYKRGFDLVLEYKEQLSVAKICRIAEKFADGAYTVYIVLNSYQCRTAAMDIAIHSYLFPIELDEMQFGRWNNEGTGIEFINLT